MSELIQARQVLIPSSSGLRLELTLGEVRRMFGRLNPFFIRSAVGIEPRGEGRGSVGLNPFFIRSAVGMYGDREEKWGWLS